MNEVMEFMLGTTSIDGTYIEHRIKESLKEISSG